MSPTFRAILAGAAFQLLISTSHAADLSITPAKNIPWHETPFGVQASPVMGDFSKGKHITFIKFKAGTSTPAHTHTHAYVGIVVTGVGVQYDPSNSKPTPLPPGSSWTVPANARHISGCLKGHDCVFALYQDEPFDYLEEKK